MIKQYLIFIFFLFLGIPFSLFAQETLDIHPDTTFVTEFNYGSSDLFDFKNINKIPYYYDQREIRKIKNFEEREDWENKGGKLILSISLPPSLLFYVSRYDLFMFLCNQNDHSRLRSHLQKVKSPHV